MYKLYILNILNFIMAKNKGNFELLVLKNF